MTTEFESSAIRSPRGTKVGTAVVRYARAAYSALRAWNNRRALARTVGMMDAHMLADIGLTRTDVGSAFSEPLWRDPSMRLSELAEDRRAADLQRRSGHKQSPRGGALVVTAPTGRVPRVKRPDLVVCCDEAA